MKPGSTAAIIGATQQAGQAKGIRNGDTIAKFALCPQRLSTNDRLDKSDCSIKTFISNLD